MSKRIEVNDLNVFYGKFKAVEDVSLTIEPRTVTAFIGPSGCGKSTFLRTLNRMHEVIPGAYVKGEVLIDGNNLWYLLENDSWASARYLRNVSGGPTSNFTPVWCR